MGVVIGLMFGLGLASVSWAFLEPHWRPATHRSPRRRRVTDLLASAGVTGVAPWQFVAVCVACFVLGFVVMAAASGVAVVGLTFATFSAVLPVGILRGRAERRRRDHAALWPDAVDNLASAVRAGLSLPDALIQLGERGPSGLREPFVRFAADYQTSGRFDQSLDLLKDRLADPTGDRVVEALRMARDVGGGDLGRVLRSLSGFLREDQRTRGEVESRQSWTVTGARIAVAAPWVVLLLMSFQGGDAVARYATTTGVLVLVGGAVSCALAYRLMTVIGRLPTERRVLV
ncbi:MAG TPA: type II secretion system F family protein [Aeromicrobium sp.]|nr:type II secretion system F family protein [Aeromicrobium sp.]